jgi:hypothetical protein
MKKSSAFILIVATILASLVAVHWCTAQATAHASDRDSKTDNSIALEQLESFVAYLQDTKQTNLLERFNDYGNATVVIQCSADLGLNIHILHDLRSGRTNEAIRLLEMQVTGDAVGFSTSYRELPDSLREKVSLIPLKEARTYCDKYPVWTMNAELDQIVTNAFKLLDQNPAP